MIKSNLKYILLFLLSVLIQVLIFDRFHFSSYISIFIYVLFILLLPVEQNKFLTLFLAFFLGLSVDIFNSTPGFHAAASVLLAYLRTYVLILYSPREGYEPNKVPGINTYGLFWFIRYALTLVLIHHLFLFFVDAFTFYKFFTTLFKVLVSTIFSLIFIVLGHLLIMKD